MHRKKEDVTDVSLTRIFDYYKLPRERKMKYLQGENNHNILNVLPEDIREMFKEGFLLGIPGCKLKGWEKVVSYFYDNSPIIREITKDPGTYSMLEKIYTRKNLQTAIDYALYYSMSSDALRNRLNAVIRFAGAYMKTRIRENNEKLLVLNLGAGTGRDTIEVCRNDPHIAKHTEIHCIDMDPGALKVGSELAISNGLTNFRFLQKDIARLRYRREADLGLLIGILCPMEFDRCVRFLKIIKRYFKPGAPVVAACVLEEMLKKDLLYAYLLREIAGWELCFRTPEEVRQMFEEAGYQYGGVFYDMPTRFYAIGIGLA